MCLLALLAYPAVILLLGDQWGEAVPLLRLMALAALAWFPVILTSPVLLAVGANGERLTAELVGRAVSAVVLCSMAWFGIMAMVLSQFAIVPFQMLVSLHFVRRHLKFEWRELRAAVSDSALVTLCTLAAPVGVVAGTDFRADIPIGLAIVVALTALPGWLFGVWATGHPIMTELERLVLHMERLHPPLRRRA